MQALFPTDSNRGVPKSKAVASGRRDKGGEGRAADGRPYGRDKSGQ